MALFVAVFTAFSLSFFVDAAAFAVAFPRALNTNDQTVPNQQYDLHKLLPEQQAPHSGSYQRCQVAEYDRVQCGEPGITGNNCEAINCCFDGQNCYYGLAVTIQCTKDAQFVLVVAKDSTLPRLSLDSINFLEGGVGVCGAADSNAAFAIFQFPVTACGTRVMDVGSHLVYENKMSSSYEVGVGPHGAITRDSHYELSFQCRYSSTSVEALLVQVNTVPPPLPIAVLGPLRVELRLANGHCATKGCVEEQVAYTSYYSDREYPVTKVLREPVYVEVRLLERSDPNIVLTLQRCWATSMPDPHSLPQWDLLVDGCPYRDDRYRTSLIPVTGSPELPYPTHYKRFVFKMFTFVDPSSMAPLVETVFIHCGTAACHPSETHSCEYKCGKQRRDVSAAERPAPRESVVSSKELIFVQA